MGTPDADDRGDPSDASVRVPPDAAPAPVAIIVTPAALSIVEGEQATFAVHLASAPAGDVEVTLHSADAAVASVAPATLRFDPDTFDAPRAVVVTSTDDTDPVDKEVTILASANGSNRSEVAVTIIDNDVQHIVVDPGHIVVDEGTSTTLSVRLSRAPSTAVSVAVVSANPDAVSVDPSVLSFTADDFDAHQSVTVAGVDDDDQFDESVTLTLLTPEAPDQAVIVTVLDDDASPPPGESVRIAIFDNADSDYDTPPFDDRLRVLDIDARGHSPVLDLVGFNTSQTVGGRRYLAMAPGGDLIVTAENVTNEIVGHDASGNRRFALSGDGAVAVTADHVYANIGGVTRFDHDGGNATEISGMGGLDLVVDEDHGVIWTVGGDLRKGDLSTRAMIDRRDYFVWYAVSVDVAGDGSVFVAERRHPDVPGSIDRVLHISPTLEVLHTTDVGAAPFNVRVDRTTGEVWVGHADGVTILDSLGNVRRNITGIGVIWSIAIHPAGGMAWVVGGNDNSTGALYDNRGTVLDSLTGLSADQKYVAVVPAP